MRTYLVTGGAGFIGSCYVLQCRNQGIRVINLDKLTYSGNLDNLISLQNDAEHIFIKGDIGNEELVNFILQSYKPQAIINFAAESHVDRSIYDPESFIRTNVLGTCTLLRTVSNYYKNLNTKQAQDFRFLHVSTDEVFGALQVGDEPFNEQTTYKPNSPYAASKASSDHLVRAFHETYNLPILISNCSNNYGARQFPEKLIPLMICHALQGKPLPIYGKGENIRDWLHVEDHCTAIDLILNKGQVGQSYCIGGRAERTNVQVVQGICQCLDKLRPLPNGSYTKLISYVDDRLGHDFRYAIDCTRLENELGWQQKYNFEQGLENTVQWYLNNEWWVKNAHNSNYEQWIKLNYKEKEGK